MVIPEIAKSLEENKKHDLIWLRDYVKKELEKQKKKLRKKIKKKLK